MYYALNNLVKYIGLDCANLSLIIPLGYYDFNIFVI